MRPRRIVLVLSISLFFLFLLSRTSVEELRARVGILRRFAGEELRLRRMAGTAAAYDRRFFQFLELAKLALPRDAKGLALYAPGIPEWGGLYLAIYHFAPFPVVIAPPEVPEGWVAAVYGRPPLPGWRVVRELPNGALLKRQ